MNFSDDAELEAVFDTILEDLEDTIQKSGKDLTSPLRYKVWVLRKARKSFVSRERALAYALSEGLNETPEEMLGLVTEASGEPLFFPEGTGMVCDTNQPSKQELEAARNAAQLKLEEAKRAAMAKLSPLERAVLDLD